MTVEDFIALALENPINRAILDRLPSLQANDSWLVAGCLFQTVWNRLAGRAATEGIKDYDIFYFDDSDLSWEAEDQVIQRAATLFQDIDAVIEVKNQARVHLWYGQRFGPGYPQLRSSRDGIDRFLVRCTCVALRPSVTTGFELYAPDGLDDLAAGILRPNPANLRADRYPEKAVSYRNRWPWLRVCVD